MITSLGILKIFLLLFEYFENTLLIKLIQSKCYLA